MTRVRVRTPPAGVEEPGYEVGYGKPPREHQFKPKQSGNLKGRPKGAHNVTETVMRHLDGAMTVRQAGKPRRMTRREVLVQKLYERALGGDNRAAALLLTYDLSSRASVPDGASDLGGLTDEQANAILDSFVAARIAESE
ncbi:DUF5681 domain-containing protein [Phenylobacterium sp.]|uniref:DUF5681 domain-containing protein n=1 Tax=Phenylobacterium sp. TaxID=1871053 RepID=UPI0025E1B6BA|nr:DUF5681 domain-containing protein [Phenylobacterium sp.]MBX3485129.1 hypothetical protein [Phenylobacterium sp.]MCW5759196.1 hypothetical protein [Phenylobacterium sp.]